MNLEDALNTILYPEQMGWIIADGKLVVTSREIAEKNRKAIEDLKTALPGLVDVRVD